jgi:thiamine transport system permease protein
LKITKKNGLENGKRRSANRSVPRMLTFKSLLPGISAASLILVILCSALLAIWRFALQSGNLSVYFDSYILHIVWITFYQAILSTSFSLTSAIIMAKALSLINFKGKRLLIKIIPITFILPTLVVVIGLLSVYGQQGVLARLCQLLHIPFSFSIYGLQGILLAHVFLNFPYACVLFYQTLNSIPTEQKQLAAQLNFSTLTFFKLIEWPLLRRQILPMAGLIFMLCFSSFAIVLALGGGPKYTTLEVAIYQAVRDFDLLQAALLACLQLICCVTFIGLMQKINKLEKKLSVKFSHSDYRLPTANWLKVTSVIIIVIGGFFILSPMISILLQGIYFFQISQLTSTLWQALIFSVVIAFGSAMISMLLGLLLLWTNSRLLINQQRHLSNRLMLIASLILAIPSMVLASGLFLLLFGYKNSTVFVCLLIMLCNGLMALPFILKNLAMPMYDITARYWQLTQTLNINGLTHFYLVDFKGLKNIMLMSFAFAAILSLGDFGIIALFGGQSIITLPYYLYQQISHYYYQESIVTAAILLLLSFSLLVVMDYDRTSKN